jgi:hypothetical protein
MVGRQKEGRRGVNGRRRRWKRCKGTRITRRKAERDEDRRKSERWPGKMENYKEKKLARERERENSVKMCYFFCELMPCSSLTANRRFG